MFFRTFFFLSSTVSLSLRIKNVCLSCLIRDQESQLFVCSATLCNFLTSYLKLFCFISLPKVYKKIYFFAYCKISDHTFRNSSKSHTQTHKKMSMFFLHFYSINLDLDLVSLAVERTSPFHVFVLARKCL